MAQIIPFPGVVLASQPAPQVEVTPAPTSFSTVRHIRGWKRVPKKNRPEDDQTIILAQLAKCYAEKAHKLAQTEPNSNNHRLALHMASLAEKLPCNNLQIFTTAEDVRQGIWNLWRQVKIANLEWELCDERRCDAAFGDDETGRAYWSQKQDEADVRRWMVYERLVRIPATKLFEVTSYKLDPRFQRGMGRLDWMRVHKPEIAAIIDEEVQHLNAEKEARKAARAAKAARTG